MVRGAITRCVSAAGAIAVAAVLLTGLTPGAAQAAPKPPVKPPAKPTVVHVEGDDVPGTIIVEQAEQAQLFRNLLSEVSWMAHATGQTNAPQADKLGVKYRLTVLNKNQPLQVYDLYPLAAGGPRAYRPAGQPTGRKAAGWFYGRLSMPETLRFSGVPLNTKPDVLSGGVGGGSGISDDLRANEVDAMTEVNGFLGEMRRLLLLNGAVLVTIMFGLAGIAFLIRRKV